MTGRDVVRIVVTGSECTGKSTLALALAAHFGVRAAPEFLRRYFEMKNGVLTLEDAVPIAQGQIAGEDEREMAGDNPVICDTNPLSSVVYNNYYYGSSPAWIEGRLQSRSYHHYLLCGIDVPWRADGQRDRPGEREHLQGLFRAELVRRGCAYTELFGGPEARLAEAVRIVGSLLE
ncbi:AAA family ATPase [Salidesulfovibrio onnuriiensis]|uniref:AAA family ATPase n=1 Tax=Salidesulfovibrio onnuriiensis TaxID=2583823 RepID=UPI0011CAE1F7|nr:ATP-binding protein [Salidesulfovibrio onnuriiensis]